MDEELVLSLSFCVLLVVLAPLDIVVLIASVEPIVDCPLPWSSPQALKAAIQAIVSSKANAFLSFIIRTKS